MYLGTLTCEQLAARVQEAADALHALRTGKQARVVVDQNGERVEFTAASQSGLIAYLQDLQQAQVRLGCVDSSPMAYRAPLTFSF